MKTTVSCERTWHPVFVIDVTPDIDNFLVEIDNEELEEYRSLVDEFIVLQNKLESMFKRITT